MTLPLTAEMLACAYEYLRHTPPFSRWNLPEPEDIKFETSRHPKEAGRYIWDPNVKKHIIRASMRGIGHTESLMKFMAHEMIHLHLRIMKWESRAASEEVHNAAFRKFAAQACKWHGFDPKAFY
jgi:hypothetical protein